MRRLLLRCRQENGRNRRGALSGRSSISFKAVLMLTVAIGVGLSLLLAVVASRRRGRNADEFIEILHNVYDEDGKVVTPPVGVGGANGRPGAGADGKGPRFYDPKARAFVDPQMQHQYGLEAEKGKFKRQLFLEVHDMTKTMGRPQLNLGKLMDMPSSFDFSKGVSDTTIILNQWTRTTLEEQLDAILRQTVRPAGGVWVCAFNSPRESEYQAVVEDYRPKFEGKEGGLFFVASSFNFKYYGRFQLALQARTKYVWVVDDDVLPGIHFLHQLSHIAGIPDAEGADGSVAPMALGSVGWVMPGVKPNENFYSYRYHTNKGGLFLPDKRYGISVPHLQEVDLLCSQWFIQTDWVKLMFREKWETAETGEDYMLAYSLRKHAGVRSYVLPMDLSDSETWGNVDVEWNMQRQGGKATTVRSMVPVRDRLWHRLLKRGGEYFMSQRYAAKPRPIVLVIDGTNDATALRALFLELQASHPPTTGGSANRNRNGNESDSDGENEKGKFSKNSARAISPSSDNKGSMQQRPPRVVLTGRGGSSASCTAVAQALGHAKESQAHKSTMCDPDSFASAWNLVAGRHFPRMGTGVDGGSGGRDHVLMMDLAAGLAGAVEALKPLAIVSVAGTGPSAGAPGGVGGGGAAIDEALAVVGGQAGVPLIRLPREPNASEAALWLTRLTPKAYRAWHRPQIDIVVVYDPSGYSSGDRGGHNEAQLKALLDSLSNAHYLGDTVGFTLAVGSGPVPGVVGDHFFSWPRGRKIVHGGGSLLPSSSAGGSGGRSTAGEGSLATLALRSWAPRDDDNFVVVIEANRVMSPLFYSWLKVTVLEMSYGSEGPKRAPLQTPSRSGGGGRYIGVCVPGAGTSGSARDTWLLSAQHWREAQAQCLGTDGGGGGGGGGARAEGRRRRERGRNLVAACDGEGYPEPPQQSLCPALKEPGEALMELTGADGALLGTANGGLMREGKVLARFVERVLW